MPSFSDILEERNIATPLRYGISQRSAFPELAAADYVRLFMRGSAPVLQLREKDLPPSQLRPLVAAGVQARRPGQLFLVNSAWDLALELGADGCHLTSTQDLPAAVRQRFRAGRPNDFLLGQSVHRLMEAVNAEAEGADYVIFGPVFDPISKASGIHPHGISGLREVAQMLTIPVVGIGGIEAANLDAVWSAGALGAAGISFVIRELSSILDEPGKE